MSISEETDQVFKGVSGDISIDDAGNSKILVVSNTEGWADTVVWNPYGDEGTQEGVKALRRPAVLCAWDPRHPGKENTVEGYNTQGYFYASRFKPNEGRNYVHHSAGEGTKEKRSVSVFLG